MANSETRTLTITIIAQNDEPVAYSGTLSLYEDKEINGTLISDDIDNDQLTYEIVSNPQKGIVRINDIHNGSFLYKPFENQNGNDSFVFKVSDSNRG